MKRNLCFKLHDICLESLVLFIKLCYKNLVLSTFFSGTTCFIVVNFISILVIITKKENGVRGYNNRTMTRVVQERLGSEDGN